LSAPIVPFRVNVPEATLDDLRRRLAATRWPEPETVHDSWSQGLPLAMAKEICHYWTSDYDWRPAESRLNNLPQSLIDIDGLSVHFLHVRSPHPGALPLLLTHGWPSSVLEFEDVIRPLTEPPDPRDAFDVVCPSLPGHAFSGKPAQTGWTVQRTASAWATLMARLGYDRYAAHGGDWGSWVTAALGSIDPEHLVGIHLAMPMAPAPKEPLELDERDQAAMARLMGFGQGRSGYAAIQSSRPQTLGYALTDSPVGQLAWIVERFWEWADHEGDLEKVISRNWLLDNVMIYWLTASAASSARMFWESFNNHPTELVHVPTGCSVTPNDAWMPRAWCERRFTDVRYWKDLDSGGHFLALEQPDVFVGELRAFFRQLRLCPRRTARRCSTAARLTAPCSPGRCCWAVRGHQPWTRSSTWSGCRHRRLARLTSASGAGCRTFVRTTLPSF
jgi:pimeloyl-ACP methyl ester carboxylesterase